MFSLRGRNLKSTSYDYISGLLQVGGCGGMANEVELAPPTILTNTEIDFWVDNIVGVDQSANSLSKIQANARRKFVEEVGGIPVSTEVIVDFVVVSERSQ
jgi:hypothetical protein